ncbi:Rieske 2Fe-2S domain-containing protein [Streptomyces sp. NPDC056716]|uniref:Rieske 2Fe-2S domain-containing protein n=1 Tax=unclassified Streptomyces TaxID=2593676 RepID=UPI0036876AEF
MTTPHSAPTLDTGTGYGRPRSSHDARLTEVGPGTPMGEALRRYWHPVASSGGLGDMPHRFRLLGEDLVVFRDGAGRPGVVFERCAHRGSSLFYGRIEEDGIRCCYHGWKFDVQGHCLEQACEPGLGRRRDAVRQPWYPVEERYGLVFVYMGPPERKPLLPRYDFLEELGEDESIFVQLDEPERQATGLLHDYNWLQAFENSMDPVHLPWLHYTHSGRQFDGVGEPDGLPHSLFDPYKIAERVGGRYERTERGVMQRLSMEREEPDGSIRAIEWHMEAQLPNIIALTDFVQVVPDRPHDCLLWMVPSDDTSFRVFIAARATSPQRLANVLNGIRQNGKLPWEVTEAEQHKFPGDFEAQRSQGPITQHSEETLATSDKGIVLLRRQLRQMVDDVEAGHDPQNIDPGETGPCSTTSGYFTAGIRTAEPATAAAAQDS